VSICCNWNDPAKLVASATATECSGMVLANVVAPLVSLIALGRAYFLIKKSEQDDLQGLIAPALKGLSRSTATVLLITVIPGGFLLHLSGTRDRLPPASDSRATSRRVGINFASVISF
jgi:hypothetical protein